MKPMVGATACDAPRACVGMALGFRGTQTASGRGGGTWGRQRRSPPPSATFNWLHAVLPSRITLTAFSSGTVDMCYAGPASERRAEAEAGAQLWQAPLRYLPPPPPRP